MTVAGRSHGQNRAAVIFAAMLWPRCNNRAMLADGGCAPYWCATFIIQGHPRRMILSRYERMIARRYLLPGKGEGFIFLVAGISLAAVMLGVAALIIVMRRDERLSRRTVRQDRGA